MLFLVLSNAKAYVTIGWSFNELGFHPAIKGKISHSCSVNVGFLVFRLFQEVIVTIYFLFDEVEKFNFAL
ncbi:hypothetical protein D3C84_951820 [compost metagenome]|jgi:hypothetical protein